MKLQPLSIDHQEQEVAVPKRMIAPWLLYSSLTILLWGVWGATSKAVANDINAYVNQGAVHHRFGSRAELGRLPSPLGGRQDPEREIFYTFRTGILGGAGNILFFKSLTMGGRAAVVVPMTSLSPLVTVMLAFLVLRERISASQIIGLAVAVVAIYLLSL